MLPEDNSAARSSNPDDESEVIALTHPLPRMAISLELKNTYDNFAPIFHKSHSAIDLRNILTYNLPPWKE